MYCQVSAKSDFLNFSQFFSIFLFDFCWVNTKKCIAKSVPSQIFSIFLNFSQFFTFFFFFLTFSHFFSLFLTFSHFKTFFGSFSLIFL